jgi:uncharacterized protein (TIGR00297 family)
MIEIKANTFQLILGAMLAFLAAAGAYRFKLLTRSGALAAFLLGWVVFGLGGWNWALILITFFISSSGWSLVFRKRKQQVESMYAKGGTRDVSQVLANGGVAGLFVLMNLFLRDPTFAWMGFCAALAAANADTWATELGILNTGKPILITSGKPVEAGTSGAISLTGTVAAAAGAGLIAAIAWLLKPIELNDASGLWIAGMILLAGILGSLVDSLLGATLQAIYYCPSCKKETEKTPRHGCGIETILIRGKKWMNNDVVNVLCTLSSALFIVLLSLVNY